MAKLHEILAVEKGLETAASDSVKEACTTFNKKSDHFIGWVKRYVPFDESSRDEEAQEEHHEMTTTVTDKLTFVFKHISKWLDAVLQKEATNQVAKANIEIEGVVLASDVPATFLLGLESKLRQIRVMINEVPTLSPGIAWAKDPQLGENVYRMEHPEKRFKTKKVIEHKILVPATEQHPAQIEKWTEDRNIGEYITDKWCGMLSPAEKSEILGRLDTLERAVKKARQRANSTEVQNSKIGRQLTEFIMNGETKS